MSRNRKEPENPETSRESRLNSAIRKLFKEPYTLTELKITKEELEEIKKLYTVSSYNRGSNDTSIKYYITPNDNHDNYLIVSPLCSNREEFSWIELSDIKAGSKFFNQATLEYVLNEGIKAGCKHVHIAGDLFAGHPKYKKQWDYLTAYTPEEQADILFNILKNYPLDYVAIKGDCEDSFISYGENSPLSILADLMNDSGIKFKVFNSFSVDIVIGGFVKRLVHSKESKNAYTKSYKMDLYIRKQFEGMGDNVIIEGQNYKILLIQFGHYTTNYDSPKGNTNLTCSTGFIFDEKNLTDSFGYPAGRITKVVANEGKIERFKSTIVKYDGTYF